MKVNGKMSSALSPGKKKRENSFTQINLIIRGDRIRLGATNILQRIYIESRLKTEYTLPKHENLSLSQEFEVSKHS